MQYRIDDEIMVFSEKTAKSYKQKSSYVVEYLSKIDKKSMIVDYGCGKLRYSKLLREKCDNLILVDSSEQLTKKQIIHDKNITIMKYARNHMSNTIVLTTDSLDSISGKADFVLCSNVLSAIPSETRRKELLENIKGIINSTGEVLFITQHINSFYTEVSKRADSVPHLDGWLYKYKDKYSYYGLINKTKLSKILLENGYDVIHGWTKQQSTFVLASVSSKTSYLNKL